MHLYSVELINIRGFRSLKWDISKAPTKKGWHVIIGDNASGKTSFLRAVALSLLGVTDISALRQNLNEWLTQGQNSGATKLNFYYEGKWDRFVYRGQPVKNWQLTAGLNFVRGDEEPTIQQKIFHHSPKRHVWGHGLGWFSAGYGPFRRFQQLAYSNRRLPELHERLSRHASLFGEDYTFSEALQWLTTLRFKKLEGGSEGQLLEPLIAFINQDDFLPHGVQLREVTSAGVIFEDANGAVLPVEELSHGFHSLLSMTFELIRQLALAYGPERVFDQDRKHVIAPAGVVLIDEIDAHLHPTWQRRVGGWFRRHFPNMQFLVTTHSPLVCQAAEVGTVFRLPQPGTDEQGEMLTGDVLNRLLYGNVLDAYSTGAFGENVGRSDAGHAKLQRLAELNVKDRRGLLSEAERREQQRLRALAPTAAATTQAEAAL